MESRKNNVRVNFPREHGAWAMFLVPLCVGIAAGKTINVATILFALTAFGFFLLRYPLMLTFRSRDASVRRAAIRWSIIYAAITGIGGVALFVMTQLWLLLPFAALGALTLAIYLWLASRRAEMSLAGEWLGIAGLALGAPGAYLVATRALDETALALYILNALYFGGTIFYVKFKVREQPRAVAPNAPWRVRLWAGRQTILYHALAFALIGACTVVGWVPALALAAFAPAMCKMLGGVLNRPARINLKHLGFIELGLSGAFALIVLVAYW
ncbi:MAG: YwiC-like family protein [Chloroflexi bacterium]|nr:YwiC-like family protein [Chloroflexota bacterium]